MNRHRSRYSFRVTTCTLPQCLYQFLTGIYGRRRLEFSPLLWTPTCRWSKGSHQLQVSSINEATVADNITSQSSVFKGGFHFLDDLTVLFSGERIRFEEIRIMIHSDQIVFPWSATYCQGNWYSTADKWFVLLILTELFFFFP